MAQVGRVRQAFKKTRSLPLPHVCFTTASLQDCACNLGTPNLGPCKLACNLAPPQKKSADQDEQDGLHDLAPISDLCPNTLYYYYYYYYDYYYYHHDYDYDFDFDFDFGYYYYYYYDYYYYYYYYKASRLEKSQVLLVRFTTCLCVLAAW